MKRHRGRPRLDYVKRETNGQKSRRIIAIVRRAEETERETMQTALEARVRREALTTGEIITPDQARNPLRGSVLGLMFLDKAIDAMQLEAGRRYAETRWRYHALTGIPFPNPKAQSLFSIRSTSDDVSPERARTAREAANRMMEIEGWLQSIPCAGNRMQHSSTVCLVAFEDNEQARFWQTDAPHMMQVLRRGLNALANGFRLPGTVASLDKRADLL